MFNSCSEESSLLISDKTSTTTNEDCGDCQGQITSLDLEYLGSIVDVKIEVYEGKVEPDKLFASFSNVNSGDVLSFVGSKKNNKMGSKIFLTINGSNPIEIHTSCSQPIYVGMEVADKYRIVAGASHDGGPLCEMDSDDPNNDQNCGDCEGQITSLDLEYLGSIADVKIEVYEGKVEPDKLFASFSNVNSGDVLSFVGSKKNNKMGSKIFLTINGSNPIEIHTSCSQPIYVGMEVANKYRIVAGASHEGGNLADKDGNCTEEEFCLDAFAFKSPHSDTDKWSFCFLEEGFTNWGWTIGPFDYINRYNKIYFLIDGANVDTCKPENAPELGYVEFWIDDISSNEVHVKIVIENSNYTMKNSNVYIGTSKYPLDGSNNPTIDPSHYGNSHENLGGVSSDSYTISGINSSFYIIVQANVCTVD